MIRLRNISRTYSAGSVKALQNVSLTIPQGEFVAIVGASGSGKSTMLHVLGLLDRPESGTYELMGRDVTGLSDDALAHLRNGLIGFVFQQFHLLSKVSAVDNAALPLTYAGKTGGREVAAQRLREVGLGHRMDHRPNQLSGGEQQRVAIARSLVNEPVLIMADEPTGNLDSKSKQEIMTILDGLHKQGKTIVMVTHEPDMAAHAQRVIQMRDGVIVSDSRPVTDVGDETDAIARENQALVIRGGARFRDHLRQAFRALRAHKLRSFLSMLGILIGVAAVIAMLAVTQGAQDSIRQTLASMGSNMLMVRATARQMQGVRMEAGAVTRLTLADADAIAELDVVRYLSPNVRGRAQAVYGNKNWNTSVQGSGPDYANMRASKPQAGRFFTDAEVEARAKVAVIGTTVVRELFGTADPLGKTIKVNRINFKVIGVLPTKGSGGWRDWDDVVVIPITTAMFRVLGNRYVNDIDVEYIDSAPMTDAQDAIQGLMRRRLGLTGKMGDGVEIRDMTEMQEAMSSTTRIMSWLLGSIAAISLIVGGIGIMNIMLVSVTERTREIGLRKAIGARRRDIMTQFLIEAVVLTFLGGVIGILLGAGSAYLLGKLGGLPARVAPESVVMAASFSILIGLIFGLWPARKAAGLDPIEALRYE